MNKNDPAISVEILGKEYRIACPPDSRQDLDQAARLLDQRMKEIKSQGKLYGAERVVIMAALNLSYELLQATNDSQSQQSQLSKMNDKIESTLTEDQQLDLGD